MQQKQDMLYHLKNGNLQIMEQLVNQYRQRLTYFIMRYVKDAQTAEKIAQQSFAQLIHANPNKSIRASLFASARKLAKCHLRRERYHVSLVKHENLLKDQKKLEQQLFSNPARYQIWKSIPMIPKRLRTTIYLVELEGFDLYELAQVLYCPPFHARVLIRQGKRHLRQILSEKYCPEEG